jgi:hypothetical protein
MSGRLLRIQNVISELFNQPLWDGESQTGHHRSLVESRCAVPRNLVSLLRSTLARTIPAQGVLLLADRVDRHLVRQADQLQAELADRDERLDEFVMNVSVAFQAGILKIQRVMVQIGSLPLIQDGLAVADSVADFAEFDFRRCDEFRIEILLNVRAWLIVVEWLNVADAFQVSRIGIHFLIGRLDSVHSDTAIHWGRAKQPWIEIVSRCWWHGGGSVVALVAVLADEDEHCWLVGKDRGCSAVLRKPTGFSCLRFGRVESWMLGLVLLIALFGRAAFELLQRLRKERLSTGLGRTTL